MVIMVNIMLRDMVVRVIMGPLVVPAVTAGMVRLL